MQPTKHRASTPTARLTDVLKDPNPSPEAVVGGALAGMAVAHLLTSAWTAHQTHRNQAALAKRLNSGATPAQAQAPTASHAYAHRAWDWLGKTTDRALTSAIRAAGLEPLRDRSVSPELQSAVTGLAQSLFGLQRKLDANQANLDANLEQLKDDNLPLTPEQKQQVTEKLQAQQEAMKPIAALLPQAQQLLQSVAPGTQLEPGTVTRQWWPTQLKETREAVAALLAQLPEKDARRAPAEALLQQVSDLLKGTGLTDEQIEETQRNEALGELLKAKLIGLPFDDAAFAALDVPPGFGTEDLDAAHDEWLTTIQHQEPAPLTTLKSVREQLRRDFIIVRTIVDDAGAAPLLLAFRALGGKDENAVEAKLPDGSPEPLDGKSTYAERVQRAIDALEKLEPKASSGQKKKIDAALAPLKDVQQQIQSPAEPLQGPPPTAAP